MADYIEKLRVAASVSLPGREPMIGYFALAPQAEFRLGPETLLERLNTHDRVIPFIRREDEATCLIARLGREWGKAGTDGKPSRVCPPRGAGIREEWVRVRFQGGAEVEGLLELELPETMNRATDFLNAAPDFFPLLRRDGIVLVNKHRVLETHLYDRSPRPPSAEVRGLPAV